MTNSSLAPGRIGLFLPALVACLLGGPWAGAEEPRVLTGQRDVVTWLAFSPDGKSLAGISRDKTVRVWDVASGKNTMTLEGHTHFPTALAYSPDGKYVASGDLNGDVRLWGGKSGKILAVVPLRYLVAADLAFSPDSKTLAIAGFPDFIVLWDVEGRKERSRMKLESLTSGNGTLAYRADGTILALLTESRVWDVTAGREVATTGRIPAGRRWELTADGKSLLVSGDPFAGLWDIASGRKVVECRRKGERFSPVAASPDGKLLAYAASDPSGVRVVEVSSGKELALFEGARGLILFSPDGQTLATGGDRDSIRLYDLRPYLPKPEK